MNSTISVLLIECKPYEFLERFAKLPSAPYRIEHWKKIPKYNAVLIEILVFI